MFDVPGQYTDDEEEKRRQLEALLGARSQAEAPPSTPESEPPAASVETLQLDAPDKSVVQQTASYPPGFTPPPAASDPAFLEHQGGHEFGASDGLMIAGMLAALLAKKPGIAAQVGGAYGSGLMAGEQQRQAHNERVDMYNSQLAEKNDPLERWKAEQLARAQAGNLAARGRELTLQEKREQRIADAESAEADPESALNKGKLTQQERINAARVKAELDLAEGRSGIELNKRKMLADLIAARGGAKLGAPTGKAGGSTLSPEKQLKQRLAENALAGMEDGTVDPLTGKPKEKPSTAAEQKAELLQTPFPGSKVDNPQAFAAATTTASERSKLEKYFTGVQQVRNSLQALQDIRASAGTEVGASRDKSDYDAALTAAIGGFTQIGQSGVLNGGEFARYKDFIPGIGMHLNDAQRLIPGSKDPTLEQLKGVSDAVERLAADGLGGAGISFAGPAKGRNRGAKSGASKVTAADAGSFGEPTGSARQAPATAGASRAVTIVYGPGDTEQAELTPAQIQTLKAKGIEVY